jgi:hypothetical protein
VGVNWDEAVGLADWAADRLRISLGRGVLLTVRGGLTVGGGWHAKGSLEYARLVQPLTSHVSDQSGPMVNNVE